MPSFRKKYAKKPRKKTYAQYKKKKMAHAVISRAKQNINNALILNKLPRSVHRFKDTINFTDISGTGTQMTGLHQFDIGLTPRYTALKAMYRQYRIDMIKIRWRLRTNELTDNSIQPHVLMRYNYDPNVVIGDVTENYLLRQSNVCSKMFIHNTPNGSQLQYTFKPAIVTAYRVVNNTNFLGAPIFNKWCDFQETGTSEFAHFGLYYFINNLPVGQIIDFDMEFNYSCRDLI